MTESKRDRERRLERATYSREQIEAVAERLIELLMSDRHEQMAYAVNDLPIGIRNPVIYRLVHLAAGIPR